MGEWHRLANWRQAPQERLAHESFLADVQSQWQPASPADRALHRRSQAVHLVARLFDGSESLAPIAISVVPGAIAMALMALAEDPKQAEYAGTPSTLGYLLLAIGLTGLALQSALSPRVVRPLAWSIFVAAPTAAGSVIGALTLGRVLVADKLAAGGLVLMALGMLVLAGLPVLQAEKQRMALRWGMVTVGSGLLITVAGNAVWTALFSAAGETLWAAASAIASVAGLLAGFALIRARPQLAVHPR